MTINPQALAPTDMWGMMGELATMFGGKKDLEAKSELYFRILERYGLDAVRGAVDRVLQEEHKFFPLAARLQTYAKEYRSQQREHQSEPPIEETTGNRCADCREYLAYHRLIVLGARGVMLAVHQQIRHRDECRYEPRQADVQRLYGQSFADPIAEPGAVQWMQDAWRAVEAPEWVGEEAWPVGAAVAGADWTGAIGPLPPTLGQLPEQPRPVRSSGFVAAAAVFPVVQQKLAAGEAFAETPAVQP